ncbi:MAG: hypothetical protein O7D30_03240, partial [Rickettsia endosymbiont of Ixodes persulcatus]|nr:hypothetical protein [Rickettsia endosymbiont of Ixodes persulcatus]
MKSYFLIFNKNYQLARVMLFCKTELTGTSSRTKLIRQAIQKIFTWVRAILKASPQAERRKV